MAVLTLSNCASLVGNVPGKDSGEQIEMRREQHAKTEIATVSKTITQMDDGTNFSLLINKPLTLEDAISYALENNLDAAVKQLESDIQKEAIVGERLTMLPSLILDGELSWRDRYDASFSEALNADEGGAQAYNYSRDKNTKRFSAELSWDLLNFGIAYFQQRQAFYQYEIAEQRRRRVIQDLKFDVSKNYWQAQTAKKSMQMAKGLVERLKERKHILQNQLASGNASELEALETVVILSEMEMNMAGFQQDYQRYKSKLAASMGLPADSVFEIADMDDNLIPDDTRLEIASLEKIALRHRPELFEQDMQEQISMDEAHIAISQLFPKPSLFYRYSYDDDSHLYDNQWHQAGMRLSFDLLSVPRKKSRQKEIAIKKSLVQTQRRSIAAAILTQLRIAVIDFEDAKQNYRHSIQIAASRRLLMKAHQRHARLGNGTYEDVIKNEAKFLFAEVHRMSLYLEMVIGEQRILNSIGSEDIGKAHFLKTKEPATGVQTVSHDEPLPDKHTLVQKRENTQVPANVMQAPKREHVLYQGLKSPRPYSLQLSSWKTKEKAKKMLSGYVGNGLNAFIVKTGINEKSERWRCYEGHYGSIKEARMAKEALRLPTAIVMKTPYAVYIDHFSTQRAMADMAYTLTQKGYSPYTLKGKETDFQILVGAFYKSTSAETLSEEMKAQGIQAQAVRR